MLVWRSMIKASDAS